MASGALVQHRPWQKLVEEESAYLIGRDTATERSWDHSNPSRARLGGLTSFANKLLPYKFHHVLLLPWPRDYIFHTWHWGHFLARHSTQQLKSPVHLV